MGAGAGTVCAMGCAGDPNLIGNTNAVDIFQNSNGAPNLANPVLLIIGIPNDLTGNLFASNPISGVTYINPYTGGTTGTAGTSSFAAGGTYGMINPTVAGTGYFGNMTTSDVYTFLNLNGPNSNSFTNWAAADLATNSINATNFGIYVFALTSVSATLGPNGLINILFSSGKLPLGTYAVAFGCATAPSGTTACAPSDSYSVPFTEAGLTTTGRQSTPEPSSLFLFGVGILALGLVMRRQLLPADDSGRMSLA
jgi:hypothetical protein